MSMGVPCFYEEVVGEKVVGEAVISVQVESKAEAGAEADPVFGDLLLVGWFVEELFEMIVFAVFVAVITQAPHGVQIYRVAYAAGDADLEDGAQVDGIPEEPHHGGDRKSGTPECEWGIVFYGKVLIGRRQVSVQGNDVGVIAYCAAEEEHEIFCLHRRDKKSGAKIERGQVVGVGDGGEMYVKEQPGIGGHGRCLEVQARRDMWFGGVTIFFQPVVDMRVVGVIEVKAAVKEQGECRVGYCLSISRSAGQ